MLVAFCQHLSLADGLELYLMVFLMSKLGENTAAAHNTIYSHSIGKAFKLVFDTLYLLQINVNGRIVSLGCQTMTLSDVSCKSSVLLQI